ncbi:thioredoxin-like protein 1 isoform X2 [Tubulanus polymorphus]|uniref:thioredoxin-like protein 1 isoform X2 n=1 Tax=Tubulanus polymorphus TaxID=672921 RepID=UPI003DA37F4E
MPTYTFFKNKVKVERKTSRSIIKSQEKEMKQFVKDVRPRRLTADDVKEGTLIPLRYVKFKNVSSNSIFVNDNQGGEETTVINYLGSIGSPEMATTMFDFKQVTGKKGLPRS